MLLTISQDDWTGKRSRQILPHRSRPFPRYRYKRRWHDHLALKVAQIRLCQVLTNIAAVRGAPP